MPFPHLHFLICNVYFAMLKDWNSYIVGCFIKRTLELSLQECKACKESRYSPLLHAHQSHGLLRKVSIFFDVVKTELHNNIKKVYLEYQKKFPTPDPGVDYISEGKIFLLNLTVFSVCYGGYITEENDLKIHGDVQIKSIGKKRKREVHKNSSRSRKRIQNGND